MNDFDAVLIGATGLVGSQVLRQLLDEPRCRKVVVLGRRRAGVEHAKVREHVIDFDAPEQWAELVRGDVLFLALGTTLKTAGSKDAQYRVDHTYQYATAKAAARNGVSTCVLVSSAGADPRSRVFYSRMKGELERDVRALGFRRLCLLQPGLLAGERAQVRRGEQLANAIVKLVPAWDALAAVRPYPADVVARAAIRAALQPEPGAHVFRFAELFRVAGA